MKTWIENLVDQHSEFESPLSFWFWSGLCTISAIVKDNVWMDRGTLYPLYPNIYVILHADSGLKKGPPISLAKDLVRSVNNTRVISGRSSIQGIMKKLGTAYTVPGGKVVSKSVGFIVASELSSSLVEDNAALTILTDLYDRNYNKDEWESLLKMESFNLKEPTVSLLGGINEAHAEQFLSKKDIQGGFLARTFIVYEKKRNKINSLVAPPLNPPNIQELLIHLRELSKLHGKFKDFWDEGKAVTKEGRFYDDWYIEFCNSVDSTGVKDDTGTLNRFGDSVLKVAMLLSLTRGTSLEITIEDLEKAIGYSEKLIGNVRETTLGRKGMSSSAPLKAAIMTELLGRDPPEISRTMLMKKMCYHYGDASEFDGVMNSLSESGYLMGRSYGKEIVYEIPKKAYEELKEFMKGKVKR